MSSKLQKYSSDFKAKVVLDLIQGDLTLAQVCAKHNVTNKSVTAWKKTFLANVSEAFNLDAKEEKLKAAVAEKEKVINELHRQLGKRTAEAEWATKKLKSLDFDHKKQMIMSELDYELPVSKRCELLGFNRSSHYYKSTRNSECHLQLLSAIDRAFSERPFYGYRKIRQQLMQDGYTVSAKKINRCMREMGLQAICPRKRKTTTIASNQSKHPYLLRDLPITHANQVWSTDITYCRVNGGFVYLAAIIDWYSKAILSWKISATMDTCLVMDVLQDALEQHGQPEIFNTDQGSQYTSEEHTTCLASKGIKISMDGKGRATDNVAIERFWRSAKYEDIHLRGYRTIRELKSGVREYIRFYNHKRFHQTLEYRTPMAVYLESENASCNKAA